MIDVCVHGLHTRLYASKENYKMCEPNRFGLFAKNIYDSNLAKGVGVDTLPSIASEFIALNGELHNSLLREFGCRLFTYARSERTTEFVMQRK